MHVAIIAWGLPPCQGSGTYRALALVREFVHSGARVTALTASRETFLTMYGADTSLEAQIPDAVHLERVPFSPNHIWPIMQDWPAAQVKTPQRWAQAERRRDHSIFPEDVYAPWLNRALEALLELHRRDPVDLVLATGNPYVDFEIAYGLHESAGVPFVLDDRDSFLFQVFTGDVQKYHRERTKRFLNFVESCQEYWCVNPGLAAKHGEVAGKHSSKIHVVENGWDPGPLPPHEAITRRETEQGPTRPARIGFIGTITRHTPLVEILEAWSDFRQGTRSHTELHLFGQVGFTAGNDLDEDDAIAALTKADGVVFRGRVAKNDVWDAYGELDVLLLAARGGELVTSGKVYEYLATGLPIVALTGPDHDALRVLRQYPRLHPALLGDRMEAVKALQSAFDDSHSEGAVLAKAQEFGAARRRDLSLSPAIRRVLEGIS